ncbi:MerR family DNA-binding transcriptional regulator [Streptomyces tendae]|uniref:MerR family DNA-binding transcriptional regulator n=1 Tax=Streptomyces tendae TaxID=1932 RepID=UPI003448814F
MRIGELSSATGASTRSLRYYEDQGLLSQIIRDILPCTAPTPPEGECTQLLARVRQVRDELARQEQQITQRREMLDRYLSGTATPAGLDGQPACSA